jgi:hypothetical protein
MAITLRTDTGSALTFTQVDTNFTSFFYSASLGSGAITLFKTGSSALGIPVVSSSITLPGGTLWTASAADISRYSDVTITGSFKQGSAGLTATGLNSHAEGSATVAVGWHSHAEGRQTQARNSGSHAEGYLTIATGSYSHAEGVASQALGTYSHAEGNANIAQGASSHAEGLTTNANGEGSHTEGVSTTAEGYGAHAEGSYTIASGSYSHAEGDNTIATGQYSHAEGNSTSAIGDHSHAEGQITQAIGAYSHAEGDQTISSGTFSHAEGYLTVALGDWSHAEGNETSASEDYSHAEGTQTIASGLASHAEGAGTRALSLASHAEGFNTVASGSYQHVQGQFNVSSSARSAFIIGNGTSTGNRSNLVFASGSQFQITGSLRVTGSVVLADDRPIYFGSATQGSTSSYAIFRDSANRLTIGNWVQEGYGTDGIKIDTSGKVQLNHISQNYGIYDTTLNIIGSGSNDGITMTQWPDTSNRYTITVQSGSQYKLNFKNSLHPDSGSFDFSGSVAIKNDLYVGGIKQFNHGMFYHTASITVANGTSGSALLSDTAVANGVSIVSGSRITVANPGYYNIQFTAQLAQGSGTANFYLWFKKNGANIANSTSVNTLPNNSNELMTVDIIDYASTAGDYYEIAHQSNAANSTLEYIAASGNYPAAPPIIVTVQQVR